MLFQFSILLLGFTIFWSVIRDEQKSLDRIDQLERKIRESK